MRHAIPSCNIIYHESRGSLSKLGAEFDCLEFHHQALYFFNVDFSMLIHTWSEAMRETSDHWMIDFAKNQFIQLAIGWYKSYVVNWRYVLP